MVCFDIADFEVIPCEWASPLHLILEDAIIINHARDVCYGCNQSHSPRLASLWCSAVRRSARACSVELGARSAQFDDTSVSVHVVIYVVLVVLSIPLGTLPGYAAPSQTRRGGIQRRSFARPDSHVR